MDRHTLESRHTIGEHTEDFTEHRHRQAQGWFEAWRAVKSGASRSGTMTDEEREERTVCNLLKLCAEEIIFVLNDDPVGCVFCELLMIVDHGRGKAGWVGDASVLRAGVRRALHAGLTNKEADPATLVRTGVANELAERRDRRIERWRSKRPEGFLPSLAAMLRHGAHSNVAILLDHLTPRQRSDLKLLLHDEISDKPVLYTRMDQGAAEPRAWLLGYLLHAELAQPERKRAMGGIPKHVLAIRPGATRTNKAEEVVFPLGPMYAHVYRALDRELNIHGHRIRDPGSVNRIAKSLGVHHDTASNWLKEVLPGLEIRPDGAGGVRWDFTPDTVARCVELVVGKKRGPKGGRPQP